MKHSFDIRPWLKPVLTCVLGLILIFRPGSLTTSIAWAAGVLIALVGAGKLVEALMGYGGFRDYGLDIVAAFDNRNFGEEVSGKMIYNITELKDFCQKENIKIGVITVPHFAAQQVADLMYESEIKAIWNFAPIHLNLPSDILVHDENMAASLALLTKQLEDKELLEAED